MTRSVARLALVAGIFGTSAAHAYTLRTTDGGAPLHWETPVVSFRVDRSLRQAGNPNDLSRTVAESLAGWGALPESPFFFQGDTRPVGRSEPESLDGVTDIVLVEEDWPHDPTFAGVTLVTYEAATGAITDADVLLNGEDFDFELEPEAGGSYDVGNVLTHELGHLLGLGHSENRDATMFAVSHPGETEKRSLTEDDAAGFHALYGGFAQGPTEAAFPTTAATCGISPKAPADSADLLGAVMVALLVLHCARRRRGLVALGAGLLVMAGAVGTGSAAVGRYLPLAELSRRANVILQGTVVARTSRWAGRLIVTDVTLEVEECWAGACRDADTRVVTELGGEVGNVGMLAPEPTALPVGTRAVVFAREVRGHLVLAGGRQAVFRVDPGTTTVQRDVTSLPDRPSADAIERLELSTLRAVVSPRLSGSRGDR